MYLSIFYCFCFVEEVSVHITAKQATEERYPYPEREEYLRISIDMEEHWK